MRYDMQQDSWKQIAGGAAAKLIEDGMLLGLGTGSTAHCFIRALAQRIREGLRIKGAVPTSKVTEQFANDFGIPLTSLDIQPELDLAIDGADEIDHQLYLIKGRGGAFLREKVVALAAHRFVVIGDVTKQVSHLGHHFPVPIEVVPFAMMPVRRRLEALGADVRLRQTANSVFVTDNGNMILNCFFSNGIINPVELQTQIKSIVGVVETGLFLNMVEQAFIGGPDGLEIVLGRV